MPASHDPLTLTVVVSAVTSAIVSGLTFVVGVRLAKDQGDRAILRPIYQSLFEHFRTLRDAVEGSRPKEWRDYAKRAERSMPLVRQMTSSGEANLLPEKFRAEFEGLEAETLRAGTVYLNWVEKTYVPAIREMLSQRSPGNMSVISGRSYWPVSAIALPRLSDGDLATIVEKLNGSDTALGLELATEASRSDTFYLYAERIEGGLGEIVRQARTIAKEDEAGRKAVADLESLKPQLKKCLDQIAARIRDPHPLRESIVRALRDLTARGA